MGRYVFSIEGMTCDHCADSIQTALEGLDDNVRAIVSFSRQNAQIESDNVTEERLQDAIESKGFRVVEKKLTAFAQTNLAENQHLAVMTGCRSS